MVSNCNLTQGKRTVNKMNRSDREGQEGKMHHTHQQWSVADQTSTTWAGRKQAEGQPTVLIVDDDPFLGEMVAAYIRDSGFAAAYCSNGEQAMQWLHDHSPALIITDLEMPVLNGWDFCDRLAERACDTGQKPPPVIVMTAQLRLTRFPMLARAVLLKPFDISELDHMLQTYAVTATQQVA